MLEFWTGPEYLYYQISTYQVSALSIHLNLSPKFLHFFPLKNETLSQVVTGWLLGKVSILTCIWGGNLKGLGTYLSTTVL